MALISKYGTTVGSPITNTGRVFFVAPSASYVVNGNSYDSSDDNDGLSPERAVRTVARAIVLATANAGDVIQLLEGTHTVTATVAVSKAGLTFRGSSEGYGEGSFWRPATILTSTGTNDELLNITADNAKFLYLTIRPTTAYSAVTWQNGTSGTAVNGAYFYRCHFDLYTPAVDISTRGIDFGNRFGGTLQNGHGYMTAQVSRVLIEDCTFESDGAQGSAIYLATCSAIAKHCLFISTGAWASPFVVASGAVSAALLDSDFVAWGTTGTFSSCVAGTQANAARSIYAARCYFAATPGADAFRGFGAQEFQAVDCYYAAATDATTVNAIARFIS